MHTIKNAPVAIAAFAATIFLAAAAPAQRDVRNAQESKGEASIATFGNDTLCLDPAEVEAVAAALYQKYDGDENAVIDELVAEYGGDEAVLIGLLLPAVQKIR
jgi:hypothetical protein